MVAQAVAAAETLAEQGVGAAVLDCHTVKPLDREAVVAAAESTGAIVTAEDHSVVGGLGGAVAEVLAEEGAPAVLRRVGLHDRFASSARDYRALMSHFGLDAAAIVNRVCEVVRIKESRR